MRNVLGSTHAGYPRRQIGDKDFALFVKAVAIAVPEAHDLLGIGHVHSPLVKGHAIGPQQIVGHRPHLVGAAIVVAVGQGHNAPGAVGVGTPLAVASGAHDGHVQHAIRTPRHQPRLADILGEQLDDKTGRDVQGPILHPRNGDRLELEVDFGGQIDLAGRLSIDAADEETKGDK